MKNAMPHSVFIRHTYMYTCSSESCQGAWKIDALHVSEPPKCPHCGKTDSVVYPFTDPFTDQTDKTRYMLT